MKKYQGLLEQIRNEFSIHRGDGEPDQEYKARIVYSLLGRMGMASLWDIQEDTKPATIVHFKRRIEAILNSYLDMYPELVGQLPKEAKELGREIYRTLLQSGQVYHTDLCALPSRATASQVGGLWLTRGMAINKRQSISGLGTYSYEVKDVPIVSPTEMFQLQELRLDMLWENILKNAVWRPFYSDMQMEFLKTEPPYTAKYWKDTPDHGKSFSLMRTRSNIGHLYYLYQCKDGNLIASQLPEWMVTNQQYRGISNACLFSNGQLPAAHYEKRGATVYLHLEYLYPPAELNLIRLYSWPVQYWNFPSDFHRILSNEVFFAIRELLEPIGYQFVEEGTHVARS